jgi:recombination protein RecT
MNEKAMSNPAPRKMTFSMAISTPAYQKLINNTLRDEKRAARFVSAITSAVAINPLLQECDPATILSGALLGESLGLSPSPQLGQYYLVPYDNRKRGVKEAQFQLGYKGYVQLALRSGYYKRLNVFAVKAGELKSWNPITEELELEPIQDEELREKTETTGYVATFTYNNGFTKTLYWSRQKMEAHAMRYSKGYAARKGYTFWEKDFDAMAFKTMLRQLISKWGIMSIDLQNAFEQDVIVDDSSADYMTADAPTLAPATDIPQIAEDINVTAES